MVTRLILMDMETLMTNFYHVKAEIINSTVKYYSEYIPFPVSGIILQM